MPASARLQLAEHTIEELDIRGVRMQDGFRFAGRARGPQHERSLGIGRCGAVACAHAVGPQKRRRRDSSEHPVDFRLRRARVDGHEHGSGEPHAEHGRDHLGSVRELHRDELPRFDARVT
jgi:hypothetical protein